MNQLFIFRVLSSLSRQSEKDSAKAEAADRERAYLNDKIEDLEFRLERQTVDLKNLTRTMHALQDQVEGAGIKGWFNKKSRAEAADKTEGEGEGDEVPVPTKLVTHSQYQDHRDLPDLGRVYRW